MVADIEDLEEMDASELHARRLNAKEVLTPMGGDNYFFLVEDGTVKTSGGDGRLRPSTFIRDRPDWGEEQEVLRGEWEELSSPTPLQADSTRDAAKAKHDFWSIAGDFIYRHHVEPRACRKKKHFLFRWSTSTLPEIHMHHNDYWNADGERELSDSWTGFTRFILLNGRPPDGYTWCGWRLTRKQTTSRPDYVRVEAYVWCIITKSETKLGYQETKAR